MLAIEFSLEKFHQYTFGRCVQIQSDHKPLESILKKPLARAPQRLQGMIMRLQNYIINVTYHQGKNMHIADMLSRACLTGGKAAQEEFEQVNMAKYLPITEKRLEEIKRETGEDEALKVLTSVVLQGWPDSKAQVPSEAAPYFSIRDEISVQDGVLFRGERVVVPCKLR